jgi:hypothetical protein
LIRTHNLLLLNLRKMNQLNEGWVDTLLRTANHFSPLYQRVGRIRLHALPIFVCASVSHGAAVFIVLAAHCMELGAAAIALIFSRATGIPIRTLHGATRTYDIQDVRFRTTSIPRVLVESERVSEGLGKD